MLPIGHEAWSPSPEVVWSTEDVARFLGRPAQGIKKPRCGRTHASIGALRRGDMTQAAGPAINELGFLHAA